MSYDDRKGRRNLNLSPGLNVVSSDLWKDASKRLPKSVSGLLKKVDPKKRGDLSRANRILKVPKSA